MISYCIIGSERCGTSSLYSYITQHPMVVPAFQKEVDFFDRYYKNGFDWYNTHFKNNVFTGEATPSYFWNPHAPRRMKEYNPNLKIILILRNPVDMAYSKYIQQRNRLNESLPTFEEALRVEDARIDGEYKKMENDDDYFSLPIALHGYKFRGRYADYISNWINDFNMLILEFDEFFSNVDVNIQKVYEFLGLEKHHSSLYPVRNPSGGYTQMNESTRKELEEYFRPYNKILCDLIGKRFKW